MAYFLKIIIWVLLIFAGYHLIRDLLQDVLKIHHPFLDSFHFKPVHREGLGKYFRFWGLPLEISIFALSTKVIHENNFGITGAIAVGLFATFLSFWAYTSFR